MGYSKIVATTDNSSRKYLNCFINARKTKQIWAFRYENEKKDYLCAPNSKDKKMSKSILIKDTTAAERMQIIREALNFGGAGCDDIDVGDLYDDYIMGKKELSQINAEFSAKNAGKVLAGELDAKHSCTE